MTQLEPVGTGLLLPVYFVVAGLQVDLSGLGADGALDLVVVLLVATAGKFLGVFTGARSGGAGAREAAVLGTLMNTRGLTELVVLGVGLQIGLLDGRLYSIFVAMAVLTTVTTGPVLDRLVRRPAAPAPAGAEVAGARAG